jgi:hypothetical protein
MSCSSVFNKATTDYTRPISFDTIEDQDPKETICVAAKYNGTSQTSSTSILRTNGWRNVVSSHTTQDGPGGGAIVSQWAFNSEFITELSETITSSDQNWAVGNYIYNENVSV